MTLDEAFAKLREVDEPVPRPLRLPTPREVSEAERRLGLSFHPDYRRFLLEVSNVTFGTLEPATVLPDAMPHIDLRQITADARENGVPRDVTPFCADNGNYYFIDRAGRVGYWDHDDGSITFRHESLADWIADEWLASGVPESVDEPSDAVGPGEVPAENATPLGSREPGGHVEALARLAEGRAGEVRRREFDRRSKVREVGVFAIGLGVIYLLLILYLGLVMNDPGGEPSGSSRALFLLPGAAMVLSGVWVLASRSGASVWFATAIVTLGFAADAIVLFNVVKLAIEVVAIVLVWRTAGQAFEEIDSEGASD